jgi:hypothetical protein
MSPTAIRVDSAASRRQPTVARTHRRTRPLIAVAELQRLAIVESPAAIPHTVAATVAHRPRVRRATAGEALPRPVTAAPQHRATALQAAAAKAEVAVAAAAVVEMAAAAVAAAVAVEMAAVAAVGIIANL